MGSGGCVDILECDTGVVRPLNPGGVICVGTAVVVVCCRLRTEVRWATR